MHEKTLAELSQALQSKALSSVELTQHYLKRIEQLDGSLNSYITVTAESALEQAKAADARIAAGNASALTGIPLAHKDLFCTQGQRTSCGSKMLDNFISPYESTVTQRFLDAGSVSLGKTNLDEFAMGSSTESSFYGPTRNPWDTDRVPGGSSGGSASAVAARLCAAATGTDTGGSIRQPASFSGIVGLKPTYGRCSRWGIVAFASSLDQAGPLTRSVADAAHMLGAMAGHDPKDSTSAPIPVPDFAAGLDAGVKGLKVGIPKEYTLDGMPPEIEALWTQGMDWLKDQGCECVEVSLPHTKYALPTYYIIAPAEASSNLARYDGVRYGNRIDNSNGVIDMYRQSRANGFGAEVKRRIILGTYVLSSGYSDQFYLRAQKARTLIQREYQQAFQSVDAIVGPVSPAPARMIGQNADDPLQDYLADIYTICANLAGVCGIRVPCGSVNYEGSNLRGGLQLMGPHLGEPALLRAARAWEVIRDAE